MSNFFYIPDTTHQRVLVVRPVPDSEIRYEIVSIVERPEPLPQWMLDSPLNNYRVGGYFLKSSEIVCDSLANAIGWLHIYAQKQAEFALITAQRAAHDADLMRKWKLQPTFTITETTPLAEDLLQAALENGLLK